ncbi:MAG TPA: adenylate/guanylate cyclase domain-containing protein [Acidimicrobiales bacterium]|nr:adenylate/guanylate cyclase domain-containing protein [Acidimicrobiales bacterium]
MRAMGGHPTTQYARAGDVHIAYQVIGDGPVDLVWAYGLASNIEVFWEEPSLAAFFRRLAEFSRLVVFDRRGCGLSDRGGALTTPTLEERADDIVAVLDAIGSKRASILGVSEGGGVAALFASVHPERTTSIVVYGTAIALDEHHDALVATTGVANPIAAAEVWARGWGTREAAEFAVPLWASSMRDDPRFVEWMGRYQRQSVSRNEVRPLLLNTFSYDLREVFPAVRVPALVLFRRDDPLVPSHHGRTIASMIPDAQCVELEGADHLPFTGDAEAVAAAIESFLVGSQAAGSRPRRLITLLHADVAMPEGLADGAWQELLGAFDQEVRAHVGRFGGEVVDRLGSRFGAVFDGPARAIRCALGMADALERRGASLRVGIHTGECEVLDDEVQGVAVHVAERMAESARAGELLVSGTVRDLVAGSGVRFGDGRDIELVGTGGHRSVFPVIRQGFTPDAARRLANEQANVFRLDGEYWTVGYRGLVVTLRDSKGLRDIARLLADPERELHVLDLVADAVVHGVGSRTPVLDATAREQYKRRIVELEFDIEEAEGRGHDPTAAREERDALVDALASAYGVGGRVRTAPDEVERARKAVPRRVRDAISRIDRIHPSLGRHLDASIRTGVFCRYAPERPVAWTGGTVPSS